MLLIRVAIKELLVRFFSIHNLKHTQIIITNECSDWGAHCNHSHYSAHANKRSDPGLWSLTMLLLGTRMHIVDLNTWKKGRRHKSVSQKGEMKKSQTSFTFSIMAERVGQLFERYLLRDTFGSKRTCSKKLNLTY